MTQPQLVVIADAASETGVGHFVRSAALAQVLTARGWQVTTSFPRDTLGWVRDEAASHGWATLVDGDDDPLERVLAERVRTAAGSVLVIDSYRVDRTGLARARGLFPGPVVVIDDVADRRIHADVVVNQNVGAEDLVLRVDPDTVTLLGPRYALLRPEFAQLRTTSAREPQHPPERILVVMGGTDPTGSAPIVADGCSRAFPDAEVLCVGCPTSSLPSRVVSVGRFDSMGAEIAKADLVVTAAGSTLWEAFCLRRPVAALCVADNQSLVYEKLVRDGAVVGLGEAPTTADSVAALLVRTMHDAVLTRRLAETGARMIDGQGAPRVATAIEHTRMRWMDEHR